MGARPISTANPPPAPGQAGHPESSGSAARRNLAHAIRTTPRVNQIQALYDTSYSGLIRAVPSPKNARPPPNRPGSPEPAGPGSTSRTQHHFVQARRDQRPGKDNPYPRQLAASSAGAPGQIVFLLTRRCRRWSGNAQADVTGPVGHSAAPARSSPRRRRSTTRRHAPAPAGFPETTGGRRTPAGSAFPSSRRASR